MSEKPELDNLRRGPSPLPIHLTLVMAEYGRLQQTGEVSQKDLENMLVGIRKYQSHAYTRNVEPLPVVWKQGQLSMSYCAAENAMATLILIPSMINRSYILDLNEDVSFVRWLASQGIDCYLLDWGNPADDSEIMTMSDAITKGVRPAIVGAAKRSGTPLFTLGYCMGGTILAAALQEVDAQIKGAVFLASPWDFDVGSRDLSDKVKMGTANAMQMIESQGRLPQNWIQSVFAAVNAGRALKKFSEFAALDENGPKAELFVAVEDWLNDGVDLPGDLAKECLQDWYGQNRTARGEWQVNGVNVDLGKINCPALVVASQSDKLVPHESSLALANCLASCDVLEPESGHIGMIRGRRAKDKVWTLIAQWIHAHC